MDILPVGIYMRPEVSNALICQSSWLWWHPGTPVSRSCYMEYCLNMDLQDTIYIHVYVIGISDAVMIYVSNVAVSWPCPAMRQLSDASSVIGIGGFLLVTVLTLFYLSFTIQFDSWCTVLPWFISKNSIIIPVKHQRVPRSTGCPTNNSTTKSWNFPRFLKLKLVLAKIL